MLRANTRARLAAQLPRLVRSLLCVAACLPVGACERTPPAATAADSPPSPATRLETLLAPAGHEQFALALDARPFEFPRDHGPHREFRHEWWYLTGHLDAEAGQRFGFELTFFRYAIAPGKRPAAEASEWRATQIYVAHFAITDVSRGQFYFNERRDREALQLAGAEAQPPRVWLQNWTLRLDGTQWQLSAGDARYALHLTLVPAGAPVLNGEEGLSRKSAEPGAASYYYSIPVLTARGELTRGSESVPVRGTAWLDREWGSGALARDQAGWDWFALQLQDGSALMFYALRKRGGTRDPFSAGTWVDANGARRALASADLDIEVLDHWRSPRGGAYPARWRLRQPALGLELELKPVLADQELGTTPRYWEGAVDVSGTRGPKRIAGRGYVELTGYAQSPE
ncbi:MAG TPA: lipocalin-like domain-containing protein [Steroidobacteraceae bacterium]|nr:lipocalin-like domain-containing protein [Steroidobacteraceae bacterium]